MSNILKFPEPKINGVIRSKYLILKKEIEDKNSPISILARKENLLRKKLQAICDECRDAYIENGIFGDEEMVINFIIESADSDDPNVNNFAYKTRIDIGHYN